MILEGLIEHQLCPWMISYVVQCLIEILLVEYVECCEPLCPDVCCPPVHLSRSQEGDLAEADAGAEGDEDDGVVGTTNDLWKLGHQDMYFLHVKNPKDLTQA